MAVQLHALASELRELVADHQSKLFGGKPGRVIVHFGTYTSFPGSEYGREIKPDELHLLFDPSDTANKKFNEWKEKHLELSKRVRMFPEPFENCFLEPGSVDELHADNLITNYRYGEGPTGARSLLNKAAEILKQDGPVYLGHTETPGVLKKEDLKKVADELGYNVDFLVEDKGEPTETGLKKIPEHELKLLEEHMGLQPRQLNDRSAIYTGYYLAKLTKKTEEEIKAHASALKEAKRREELFSVKLKKRFLGVASRVSELWAALWAPRREEIKETAEKVLEQAETMRARYSPTLEQFEKRKEMLGSDPKAQETKYVAEKVHNSVNNAVTTFGIRAANDLATKHALTLLEVKDPDKIDALSGKTRDAAERLADRRSLGFGKETIDEHWRELVPTESKRQLGRVKGAIFAHVYLGKFKSTLRRIESTIKNRETTFP